MMAPGRVSVIVCRGCCCGSDRKHPEVDHGAQVAVLRAALPANGRLWTVDCLGPCDQSNVVVIRTPSDGRRWFGGVLTEAATSGFADWVRAGAIGVPPQGLATHEFSPTE